MKIAILSNPSAGGGRQTFVKEKLGACWPRHELSFAEPGGGAYLAAFRAALTDLLHQEPDLLITVGGDGTAAYAAEELIRLGCPVPLLGIGAGTANVGPIVQFSLFEELPDPVQLKEGRLGAIEALTGEGEHLAFGFNDLVLGNTFLGTKDGKTATFSAEALAKDGLLEPEEPCVPLQKESAVWQLNGEKLSPPPFAAAQLIASPVEQDDFYGRAVTGALCYTPDSPQRAAVFISPVPIVSMAPSPAAYTEWLPGSQLLLSKNDELFIGGLWDEVCAVADGNPHLIPGGQVILRYVPDTVTVLKRKKA